MAIVQFKYGNGALPSVKNSGALYLNQYNKKIYVDLDESNRVCIGDFQKVNWASSSTVTSPGNALKALTIKDNNILYLTYDLTTGHSALWYYDDSNSQNAQFREIISSESISIIASEFDRIDEELTGLNSELENLAGVVNTKVNKEELEGYNFATEEEAAAFAIAAISNVQGNATDTAEILTIYGARKYADALNTLVNSKVDTIASNVNTKVSKEELEGYYFVTEDEAAAFAIAAISNVQGNATSDTAEILTIQGTRKYADALNTALNSRITTNTTKLGTLEGNLSTLSTKVDSVDTKAGAAKTAADKANTDLVGVKATAESAAETASGAASLAQTAKETADSKTTLQAVKDYISDTGYTTTSAVNTAIENAVKSTKEYSDAGDQKIISRIDTLEQNIGNLSNIMNFLGVLTIDLNHEATTNPITINGKSHTAVAGDVVIDNAGEEFVFDGSKWQQIGNITAETAAINNLQTRMTTAEGNITDLLGRMTTGEGNITNLQGRMTTAESNLQTINTTIGTKLTHSTDTLWGVLTWGTW